MSDWVIIAILCVVIYILDILQKHFLPKKQKKKTKFERNLQDRYAQSKKRVDAQTQPNTVVDSSDLSDVDEATIAALEAMAFPNMPEDAKKKYLEDKKKWLEWKNEKTPGVDPRTIPFDDLVKRLPIDELNAYAKTPEYAEHMKRDMEEKEKKYAAHRAQYKAQDVMEIAGILGKRVVQLGGTDDSQTVQNNTIDDAILMAEIDEVRKGLLQMADIQNTNADAAEVALKKLGYKPKDIKDVMNALRVSMPKLSVEDYIKKGINLLS